MKYDAATALGLSWAGLIPIQTAYDWDPGDAVAGAPATALLGVEAPIWSETLTNVRELEFMAFPQSCRARGSRLVPAVGAGMGRVPHAPRRAGAPLDGAWASTSTAPRRFRGRGRRQLHNSTTPQLRNSTTPQLHNSATPQLRNSTTSQLRNSATPQLPTNAPSSELPKLPSREGNGRTDRGWVLHWDGTLWGLAFCLGNFGRCGVGSSGC